MLTSRSALILRAAQRGVQRGGVLLALLALGCTHDLDALKTPSGGGSAGSGSSGSGSSGSGASGSGSSGSGASGTGGNTQDAGFDPDAGLDSCDPCEAQDPVKNGSITITPQACCYGASRDNCGVTFASSERCYPVTVEGKDDPTCPDLNKGDLSFGGCCRADAQCGVAVDAFNLGCVARTDVPKLLGGPLSPRSCVPTCTSDAECTGFSDTLACVEDDTHQANARHCATFCQRDADCNGLPGGLLCVLLFNKAEDRVDQYCRKPLGTGKDGDSCTSADDCQHGACVPLKPADTVGYCTKLCGGDGDFTGTADQCSATTIPTPVSMQAQPARICRQ